MSGPRRAGGTNRASLEDQRDFLLRSIADLDAEAAAGDLDPADHQSLRADYTARAARVLRALQALDGPATPDEPATADEPDATDGPAGPSGPGVIEQPAGGRRSRGRPLAIGAAAVVVVGALAIAVTSAVGARDPGGVATGGAVGTQREADLLLAGEQAASKGSNVTALQDFESVLKTDPNQVIALTDEGWILAQTQQPQLLAQGIGLLGRAESINPTYPPAHVYRGVAYLSEDDYADAARELQAYLAGQPDPALLPRVRQALAQAQAGAARMGTTPPTAPPTTGAPGASGAG